jgi:hypothetical protein
VVSAGVTQVECRAYNAGVAYREHTTRTRPNEVVRYRPARLFGALFFMAVILAIAGVVLGQAIVALRRVELTCEPSMCTVRHHYGPHTTERPVAVGLIATIDLRILRNKKNTTYVVTLYAKDGRAIDLASTPLAMRATEVRAAAEALAMHGASGRLTTQEGSTGSALIYTLFALALVALSMVGLRSARLEFDFTQRTIDFVNYRWPLPPRRRVLAAESVVSAVVTPIGPRALYELELVISGEENLRLVRQTSGDRHYQLEIATAINSHLSAMQDP